MKVRALSLLLALGAASSAEAANFESPEAAVRALEDAYARRDANAAVAARDFTEEARRMLQSIGSGLEKEADILKQAAEVLELAYRKELKESIFRRFKGVRCAVTSVVPVDAISAESVEAAAKEYLRTRNWHPFRETVLIPVWAANTTATSADTVFVAVHPDEPVCSRATGHDWRLEF